ncbi:kelch-like protein 42 isoform X3 [Myxocyprinus asiaticus]|uniref:kelch-like protein 42 isoform X3 n=1 Tax=Myxocyprinus asiaticus TaxID=70543 RepID=UPI0022216FCA|nr:kelch-like protein 42 isoform X3 [Myxocyprinus asiaticus]
MTSPEQIIEIVTDEKTFNVSKSKLIEKSDYFRALYSSGMRESAEDSVQLQGLSGPGLELVLEFINTSKVQVANETLEDLIETASFLQVTSILKLLLLEIRQDNCVELFKLSELYGTHDLRNACLKFMCCYYHPMLRRPEFWMLPAPLRDQIRDMRMKGTATLVALGDFTDTCLDLANQDEPWSMLRYDELEQRWKPLANNLPPDMTNVRGYGSAVLDNYLFVVGGYRMASQEISVAHCYNPCKNEWNHVAPLNQKRNTSVLRYCPASDTWSVYHSCSAHVRKQQMLSVEDTIFLVGGYTHDLDPAETGRRRTNQTEDMLTVQSYNVQTGEWLQLKKNTSKSGLNLTCALHNDGIYIMSRDVSMPTSLEHRVFLKYNIFADAWEAFRRFPALGQNMLLCSLYLPNVL